MLIADEVGFILSMDNNLQNTSNTDNPDSIEQVMEAASSQRWTTIWNNGLRDALIIIGIFLVYRISSGVLSHGYEISAQHAYDIVNLEKSLGIFVELDIQSFFLESAFLKGVVNTIYTVVTVSSFFFLAEQCFHLFGDRNHSISV